MIYHKSWSYKPTYQIPKGTLKVWKFPASRLPPNFAVPAASPPGEQPSLPSLPSATPTQPRYEGRCHCTLDEKSDGMLMAGRCFYYTTWVCLLHYQLVAAVKNRTSNWLKKGDLSV